MADETKEKRTLIRRPAEERIAEIDDKIAHHQECIEKLEKKKKAILNPKKRASKASRLKVLMDKAKKAGFTDEEIAEKLGLTFDDDKTTDENADDMPD